MRTVSFACLFAVIAYIQPAAYRHAYPTHASRLAFAHSFANNKAIRLFYGAPHNLLTIGGYTAWRVGGTLAIFAAVFGLLAAVRALRTEEDTGRTELVLAGALGRRTAYLVGSRRDRRERPGLWAGGVRGPSAGGVAGGRLGISRALDGLGDSGVRRAWAPS